MRSGMRPEQTSTTPDHVYEVMESCWNKDRTKRPTFVALRETISYMMAQNDGPSARDIGALLNKDLAGRIKKLSVRVRKKTNGALAGLLPLCWGGEMLSCLSHRRLLNHAHPLIPQCPSRRARH